VTLTLTSDDLESDIVVNDSSTLTNTIIWFVAALSLVVDVRTYGWTDSFREDDLKMDYHQFTKYWYSLKHQVNNK